MNAAFRPSVKTIKKRGTNSEINGFKSSKASRKIIYEELDEN